MADNPYHIIIIIIIINTNDVLNSFGLHAPTMQEHTLLMYATMIQSCTNGRLMHAGLIRDPGGDYYSTTYHAPNTSRHACTANNVQHNV